MSSRLERALNLLSSDKTSLSLKRDAADRITEVLLQSEDSVPSILEQICTQLLDSRNNNCRICCASVLKSFSEKYKTNFFFSLENSQFLVSTGSTFERCSVFDEPSLFVDTYEELQSKETTVYDSLSAPTEIGDIFGSTNQDSKLPSLITSQILEDSKLLTTERSLKSEPSFSSQLKVQIAWPTFSVEEIETRSEAIGCESSVASFLLKTTATVLNALKSSTWERRHGAALGLKHLIVPMSDWRNKPKTMFVLNFIAEVFLLDNFSDFVSEETSIPVRELLADVFSELVFKLSITGRCFELAKKMLNGRTWRLQMNSYLLLKAMFCTEVKHKNAVHGYESKNKWNQVVEVIIRNDRFDDEIDSDISRLQDELFLNVMEHIDHSRKQDLFSFVMGKLTRNSKSESTSFANPTTLKLVHSLLTAKNPLKIDLEVNLVKNFCWSTIFNLTSLSENIESSQKVIDCLQIIRSIESNFVADCYLCALLCLKLYENSEIINEIRRFVEFALNSFVYQYNKKIYLKIGKVCQNLLEILLLKPTSIIEIDSKICEYKLQNAVIEVPNECNKINNKIHDQIIRILAMLISVQPDFAQIVPTFLSKTNGWIAFLNVRIGLEALNIANDSWVKFSQSDMTSICSEVENYLCCEKFYFQEQLSLFSSIKTKLKKLSKDSANFEKLKSIDEISLFLKSFKGNKSEEDGLLQDVRSELNVFNEMCESFWTNLRLLAACVLIKLESLLEKLSPLVNALIAGLKSGANLSQTSLASKYLISLLNSNRLSEKATEKLCEVLLRFISEIQREKVSEYLEDFGKSGDQNQQKIQIIENFVNFLNESQKIHLQMVIKILVASCALTRTQKFILDTLNQSNNVQMRIDALINVSSLLEFSDENLEESFVETVLSKIISLEYLSNKEVHLDLTLLRSQVMVKALLNPQTGRQGADIIFMSLLDENKHDRSRNYFDMLVIYMAVLEINRRSNQNSASTIFDYSRLIVSFVAPVLKSITSYDNQVRCLASRIFGLILHKAVNVVDCESSHTVEKGIFSRAIMGSELMLRAYEESSEFLSKLINNQAFATPKISKSITVNLRSYQKEGISWLQFLRNYNLNGILADDLGLGKTLMCICVLADQMENHVVKSKNLVTEKVSHVMYNKNQVIEKGKPICSLVVCPKSLIHHWNHEIQKFCPKLNIDCIDKRKSISNTEQSCSYIVRITSYDILRSDIEQFASHEYDYIILDEGHVIKNRLSKTFLAIQRLRGKHRLVLTGTPIQNSVCELWTLFEFLVPSYLGSIEHFKSYFSNNLNKNEETLNKSSKTLERNSQALKQLHAKVLPLILRREKESVLKELPPKVIQDIYCTMSQQQKDLYEKTENKFKTTCSEKTSSLKLMQILLQICNDPALLNPRYNIASGKMEALSELLSSIFSNERFNRHRVLMFFQIKATMKLVREKILEKEFKFLNLLILDGSLTPAERMGVVKKFNGDPTFDLLLSTTAVGGVGLNLTGADTVVFVEHDFNPVKDLQAMDRTHRIGQTKTVTVYRLITKDSIEERIMSIQKFKSAVANSVINEENSATSSMQTASIAESYLASLDEDAGKQIKRRKVEDSKGALLQELDYLWEPLSKIDDLA